MAIHLISQAITGPPALAPKRDLCVSCSNAWLLNPEINCAMARREASHRLRGTVQLDDTYLGCERSGGEAGRGSENKVPFVVAVSVNHSRKPIYLKLNEVSGFTAQDRGVA